MMSLHAFLVLWSWFSHQLCTAYQPATTGPRVPGFGPAFFQGSCPDAVSYAGQVGGNWAFTGGHLVQALVS